jgi:hypothetical protein
LAVALGSPLIASLWPRAAHFRILKTRVEIVGIAYGGRDFERELCKGK